MLTLCIRYEINPNKLTDFASYVRDEQEPIRRSGGKSVQYFLPTAFAGYTNEAIGLVDFSDLADYEKYRSALANQADHKENVARLEQSGAIVSMHRSMIQRLPQD
jgi:hypothetical protein